MLKHWLEEKSKDKPAMDIWMWPEEDGDIFPDPIIAHMLKIESFLLGMQYPLSTFWFCGFPIRRKTTQVYEK